MTDQSGFSITQRFDTDLGDAIAKAKTEGECLLFEQIEMLRSLLAVAPIWMRVGDPIDDRAGLGMQLFDDLTSDARQGRP